MSRALIALCLALQAVPARYTVDAVRLRASAPLPTGRRPVALWSDGRQVATGTWLVSGDRHHVAFRNPLGQPVSIVRIAHGLVGLELVGDREVVATDASAVLLELTDGVVDASDLAGLLLDRIPARARLQPLRGDFVASGPGFSARLDREGRVHEARVGQVTVDHRPDGVHVTDGTAGIRVVLGPLEPADLPDVAFEIGTERVVPTVSATRVGALARRRLLGL